MKLISSRRLNTKVFYVDGVLFAIAGTRKQTPDRQML